MLGSNNLLLQLAVLRGGPADPAGTPKQVLRWPRVDRVLKMLKAARAIRVMLTTLLVVLPEIAITTLVVRLPEIANVCSQLLLILISARIGT